MRRIYNRRRNHTGLFIMTETNEQPTPPIAEVLISTGVQLAQEQNMKLAELVGHFQIATFEVFNRNVAAAQASQDKPADQPVEPAADADTPGQVVAFQDEAEDKDEK